MQFNSLRKKYFPLCLLYKFVCKRWMFTIRSRIQIQYEHMYRKYTWIYADIYIQADHTNKRLSIEVSVEIVLYDPYMLKNYPLSRRISEIIWNRFKNKLISFTIYSSVEEAISCLTMPEVLAVLSCLRVFWKPLGMTRLPNSVFW